MRLLLARLEGASKSLFVHSNGMRTSNSNINDPTLPSIYVKTDAHGLPNTTLRKRQISFNLFWLYRAVSSMHFLIELKHGRLYQLALNLVLFFFSRI